MTFEEGLELIEQVLPQGQLSKVQEVVFRHSWEGQSYKEIAEQFDYTLGYIKDTGSDLWKTLSDALGEKVTRRNFQVVLKRVMRRGSGEWGMGSGDVTTLTPCCDWGVLDKEREGEFLGKDVTTLTPCCDWGEANLSAISSCTSILAGLRFQKNLIRQLFREDIMRESVIYQDILEEGLQKGLRQGIQQGELTLLRRLITRKFAVLSPELDEQIQRLSIPQLEDLGEALFEFSAVEDLASWLEANQPQ